MGKTKRTQYKIGQVFPPADTPPIFHPGKPRWHVLKTKPMKEALATAWLREAFEGHDVRVFYPVEPKKRVMCGREHKWEHVILPGYVFAQFPGPAILDRVMACRYISDYVRTLGGKIGILDPAGVRFVDMLAHFIGEEEKKNSRIRQIRRGDKAIVCKGVNIGKEVEVIELKGQFATFSLEFLGAERRAKIDVADLERIVPMGGVAAE